MSCIGWRKGVSRLKGCCLLGLVLRITSLAAWVLPAMGARLCFVEVASPCVVQQLVRSRLFTDSGYNFYYRFQRHLTWSCKPKKGPPSQTAVLIPCTTCQSIYTDTYNGSLHQWSEIKLFRRSYQSRFRLLSTRPSQRNSSHISPWSRPRSEASPVRAKSECSAKLSHHYAFTPINEAASSHRNQSPTETSDEVNNYSSTLQTPSSMNHCLKIALSTAACMTECRGLRSTTFASPCCLLRENNGPRLIRLLYGPEMCCGSSMGRSWFRAREAREGFLVLLLTVVLSRCDDVVLVSEVVVDVDEGLRVVCCKDARL